MPVGWTEHQDSQGRLFFYHVEQRTSWWTHPLEDEHRAVHKQITAYRLRNSAADAVALGGLRGELWQLEAETAEAETAWSEHWDQDGHIFYFNRHERLSSWTDPRPAIQHRLRLRQRGVRCLLSCRESAEEPPKNLEVEPDRPAWLEQYETGSHGNDPWRSPRLLLMECAAECPVCYDPLCTSRPSVLASMSGSRICGHYFCYACARRLQSGCPLCRARPQSGPCTAIPLPDIEKRPWQWFAMVDADGDGRLEQAEAVKALEAVLPLDAERLWRTLAGVQRVDVLAEEGAPAGDIASPTSAASLSAAPASVASLPPSPLASPFAGVASIREGSPAPPAPAAAAPLTCSRGSSTGVTGGGGVTGPRTGQGTPSPEPPVVGALIARPLCVNLSREETALSLGCCATTSWWREWERDSGDGQGGISAEAFCAEGGMLQWIVEHLGELRRAEKAGEAPDLRRDGLERWFDFWDVDSDGGLSRAELLRALMKTLRVAGVERRRVSEIRRTIEKCFHTWAQHDEERVSREAFLSKPNGLGELLLQALFPSYPKDEDLAIVILPTPPASPRVPSVMPASPRDGRRFPAWSETGSGRLEQKLSALRSMSQCGARAWNQAPLDDNGDVMARKVISGWI
eukprot:TRINITY_DN25619_c0_g1_i1.p1 TRINITY_DN25619_c0_g1~~TRINITY_DN25619_c0_g1_i1.p1  ORF type:complete len:731 (+),score=87.22 TRINITY_DN25619_c0_g1_i1:308-2194(+)